MKLDEALKRRIDRLAAAKDRSAHWIMREAIREYVEREEQLGALEPQVTGGSFQDRAQDEIVPPATKRRRPEQPHLRSWSEVITITPSRPDPEREAAWERFRALGGAATSMSSFRSKDDIDAYIRWLRDND